MKNQVTTRTPTKLDKEGNKVGIRTPKWDKKGRKVGTRTPKWDKYEKQIGNKNYKVG